MEGVITGRRHLGSDRWIKYAVYWFESEECTSVYCMAALGDENGPCKSRPAAT